MRLTGINDKNNIFQKTPLMRLEEFFKTYAVEDYLDDIVIAYDLNCVMPTAICETVFHNYNTDKKQFVFIIAVDENKMSTPMKQIFSKVKIITKENNYGTLKLNLKNEPTFRFYDTTAIIMREMLTETIYNYASQYISKNKSEDEFQKLMNYSLPDALSLYDIDFYNKALVENVLPLFEQHKVKK